MTVRRLCATAGAVAVVALPGCSAGSTDDPPAPSAATGILAAYDLDGLDGREIVDRLDRTPVDERPTDLVASVRPGELLLSQSGTAESVTVELPDDEFYLSVAPYRDETHDCDYHSLTTCRGELAGEPVHVEITDRSTGEVLVDESVETFDNGFVGYWLPSGIDATLQVQHDGARGSGEISTNPDDPTCLTTLRLTPVAAR